MGLGLRNKCPNCGRSGLFVWAFEIRRECQTCGMSFERGEGFSGVDVDQLRHHRIRFHSTSPSSLFDRRDLRAGGVSCSRSWRNRVSGFVLSQFTKLVVYGILFLPPPPSPGQPKGTRGGRRRACLIQGGMSGVTE